MSQNSNPYIVPGQIVQGQLIQQGQNPQRPIEMQDVRQVPQVQTQQNISQIPQFPMQNAPQQMIYPSQVLPFIQWKDYPMIMRCPFCNNEIVTQIERKYGLFTFASAGAICVFGCWAGCCLVPFCVDICKDVEHKCPSCQNFLGKHNKL